MIFNLLSFTLNKYFSFYLVKYLAKHGIRGRVIRLKVVVLISVYYTNNLTSLDTKS